MVSKKMESLQLNGSYDIEADALRILRNDFVSGVVTEAETLAEIKKIFMDSKMIICPHTAVGTKVSRNFLDEKKITISLATAHPAKFGDAVEKAIRRKIVLPKSLDALFYKREKVVEAPNDVNYLKDFIRREQ